MVYGGGVTKTLKWFKHVSEVKGQRSSSNSKGIEKLPAFFSKKIVTLN